MHQRQAKSLDKLQGATKLINQRKKLKEAIWGNQISDDYNEPRGKLSI